MILWWMTQSGVVLGCELLRGQGFPDGLLVSGSVEIESEDGEPKTLVVPPVSASWLALWSVQSQLNYMLHVVSSQAWCVLLFQSVRQSIIIHATLTLTLFFLQPMEIGFGLPRISISTGWLGIRFPSMWLDPWSQSYLPVSWLLGGHTMVRWYGAWQHCQAWHTITRWHISVRQSQCHCQSQNLEFRTQ